MKFSENRWLVFVCVCKVIVNLLKVRAFIQYEGAFGGMSFVAFRGHIVETCSRPICLSLCDYLWDRWYLYRWIPSINPSSPIVKTLCEAFLRALSTSVLKSIIWRLIDYEFWILYSTLVKAYCDSEGTTRHWLLPILLRRSQFYLMFSGCIVTHLDIWIYNVLSTYVFVMLSLQWIPSNICFTWMDSIYIS